MSRMDIHIDYCDIMMSFTFTNFVYDCFDDLKAALVCAINTQDLCESIHHSVFYSESRLKVD